MYILRVIIFSSLTCFPNYTKFSKGTDFYNNWMPSMLVKI